MVNALQKIYNRTPWQQKRLSQPISDPNYVAPPPQDSSIYEEPGLTLHYQHHHQHHPHPHPHQQEILVAQPSSSAPSPSPALSPLQRQVSISEPVRGDTPLHAPGVPGHDGTSSGTKDDSQPLRRGLTRADTKISLRKSKKDSRRIFVNVPPPPQYLDKSGAPKTLFGSNRIKTAKYSALTFLPKNLFEQFRRVANVFFLFMAIIQLTPIFTVGSPFLTVFPLCFVVGVTAIKDGFEDYKRHVEDRNFNQRLCQQLENITNYNYPTQDYLSNQRQRGFLGRVLGFVFSGLRGGAKRTSRTLHTSKKSYSEEHTHMDNTVVPSQDDDLSQNTDKIQDKQHPDALQPEFVKEQWANLRVGDFIMLKNNQAVPADAIILSTSEAEGSCYIETKDLDGETNLKTRVSVHETSKYNTARRCSRLKCYVDMEPINANLFTFNGSLTMLAKRRSPAAHNRFSVYAPSVTSSMISNIRGSMDDGRDDAEDQAAHSSDTSHHDTQFPAQGGTSASDYAHLHKSRSHQRRSRMSESLESGVPVIPGDKQLYDESTEIIHQDREQHSTPTNRNSLYRTPTGRSTTGGSELAKNVLKAKYEQQFQHQHETEGIRREPSSRNTRHASMKAQYKETTIPIDINNMLLRGHVVRNTHWVIAVIVATGTDTKIMLNSGETPSKRSRIEKTMNIQVAINFGILVLLCIICAIGSTIYDRKWRDTSAQELWDSTTRGVVLEGVITFFTSLIIFQNIIPISLYISIEFVKTFQAFFIWKDSDMYDIELDQFCTPKTWNLTDDLGQIEYVFSDKTGTLTRNIMEFKKCSINGKIYGNNAVSGQTDAEKGIAMLNEGQEVTGHDHGGEIGGSVSNNNADQKHGEEKEAVLKDYDQEIRKYFDPVFMDPLEKLSFADPELLRDMNIPGEHRSTTGNGEGSSSGNHPSGDMQEHNHDGSPNSNIRDFFTLLSLCHTVVVEQPEEEIDDEDDDDDFGEYDDGGSPKNRDENNGTSSNVESKGGLHFGLRDKLKQKAGAVGLSVPGSSSAQGSGTRTRKTSNNAVSPMAHGQKDELARQQGTGSGVSLDEQEKAVPVLRYRAESPDEAALVSAAKNVGYVFVSRGAPVAGGADSEEGKKAGGASGGNSRQNVNVNFMGRDHTYEQLDVIKFNSTRKRMTVIVREPAELGGKILLLTQGADNVIFERLSENGRDDALRDQTEQDIETFSNMGLRTLTLAQRVLDQQTYEDWSTKYAEASKALDERAKKMDQVAEEIERDLTLIGATAIEDKLQEGVPESIAALRQAGIKVWVLTGDKLETAINIGFASRLLEKDMSLEIMKMGRNESPGSVLKRFEELVQDVLNGRSHDESQENILPQSQSSMEPSISEKPVAPPQQQESSAQPYSTGNSLEEKNLPPTPSDASLLHGPNRQDSQNSETVLQHALIVDGSALKILLDDHDARQNLIRLSDVCFSVICCRASPLQKALVVELIRRGKKTVCLAIGDGANDVSMIQAANIGVGIAGQEGMQAAMASDYSITQFRFISKLVLVHGHWGYMRIAEMILNFFFKNVLWVGAVLWFQFYCGFSAMLFYDYTFVSLYNLMLTAVPVLVLGATDQDLIAPYVLRFPGVYKLGIHQKRYNQYRFVAYMLDGVWQSLIVFWFWRGVYEITPLARSGIDGSLLEMSTSVAISNVVIASLYVGLHTYHWTWLMHFAVWGSIVFLALLVLIYGEFTASPIYHVGIQLLGQGPFWFNLILSVVAAFLVRYTVLFVSFWWFPDDVHVVRGIMISEKSNAKAKHVRWTGLGSDGMEPQEQSLQEKAILKKEDEKRAAKEAEKAEKLAAKQAQKHGHGHEHGNNQERPDEQDYDLTMIHINHSQEPSSSALGPHAHSGVGAGPTGSPALRERRDDLLAPNDPAFQHNRRTSSYNYAHSLQNKPSPLPPVPSPALPPLPSDTLMNP